MIHSVLLPRLRFVSAVTLLGLVAGVVSTLVQANDGDRPASPEPAKNDVAKVDPAQETAFKERVEPLLQKHCIRCHNVENPKSGVRVDQLGANPEDRQLFLWRAIQKLVEEEAMPPADEPQMSADDRKAFSDWITGAIASARKRDTKKNGSVRRLTVAQYRNTLKALLGLEEDLTDSLPPDGTSKDGFSNQSQSMVLSPLQVETYFDIAEKALDLCIVDEAKRPVIQNFRMDLGTAINPQPCPDNLILGANSFLLSNPDVLVTELSPAKPFDYEPFRMRTKYDFIEGYVGNDTIREWRKFDSIYHSVFACMRGSPGYPKGDAFQVVPQGLLLRPAIPSPEIFGQSDTYGPMANFKISLRELPDHGNFRVTVRAARYDDALLLDPGAAVEDPARGIAVTAAQLATTPPTPLTVSEPGIYQLDVYTLPEALQGPISVSIDDRQFASRLPDYKKPADPPAADAPVVDQGTAVLIVRLAKGDHNLMVKYRDNAKLSRLVFTRLNDDNERAQKFATFEKRRPSVGVYVGLRRDCGSTLTQVQKPLAVESDDLQSYVFEGAINDYPSPDVEKDNVNYLAGIREIGVRSEYTDGRDMPRLLIRSIEFEGPVFDTWPPATHRNIFNASSLGKDPADEAREVIRSFATRAFRRPVTQEEENAIFAVWQSSFATNGSRYQSMKDALLVVLTSPQFLFLIENSPTPEPEDLDDYELASKLSYFLWNSPPDERLLSLAANQALHASLDAEITRMLDDRRFEQAIHEFGSQWLSLDKLDVLSVDSKRFPHLTRDAKAQLRQEPIKYLNYLIQQNLSLKELIHSDFIVANEIVANYYGLGNLTESGFKFVPIRHSTDRLGGLLTQAGILAGLSDGRESNPIKRGAWVARKIVAEPPDDPPPNVPQLPQDDGKNLTIRQKLEQHRDQPGCAKCHAGIDPWGFPFESFDASGLKKSIPAQTDSKLPDGTEVKDLNALKAYLADDRLDQVAFSFMKHLAIYAIGRSLTYNEHLFLQEEGKKLRSSDYAMRDMIRFVIKSDLFQKK